MGETETPKQREDRLRNEAAMKKFTAEMKAERRREEHAKFLREQMAFEEARRERERHKIWWFSFLIAPLLFLCIAQ